MELEHQVAAADVPRPLVARRVRLVVGFAIVESGPRLLAICGPVRLILFFGGVRCVL